jgi:uncharacterized protein with PCYCGC motif
MKRSALAILALCGVVAVSACAKNEQAPAPATTTAATDAAKTAASPVPTPEQEHPQPVVVVPPRPKPGAPHGPGFDMPLLELEGYAPARPMEVLRDAHIFTADHPEVASYVPCYCGCGSAGHKHNADCFVKGRDPVGRVTQWDPHGVSCAVCIDIAVDSMKMHNSGASVTAIRSKVQNDYRARFPNSETPTPAPPQKR